MFGRIIRVLTDESRNNIYQDGFRKIIISIFYSTKINRENKFSKYIDLYHPKEDILIEKFKMFGIDDDYVRQITSKVIPNAPFSSEIKHPVVIFSPGFGIERDMTTLTIDSLLEAGYIVVTVGHVFDSMFTIFPDGTVNEQHKDVGLIDKTDFKGYQKFITIRSDDISFVINELTKLNQHDEIFKNKLDMNKLGVMGHSLGGTTVLEAAYQDKRIKAGILLDGGLCDLDLTERLHNNNYLNTPFLNFRQEYSTYESMSNKFINDLKAQFDENSDELNNEMTAFKEISSRYVKGQKDLYQYLTGFKSFIKLKGAEHMNFTDIPVILNKNIDTTVKLYEIINKVNLIFFNEFLLGKAGCYTKFIKNNPYQELCEIDSSGNII